MAKKFKKCAICGQIISFVKDTGVPVICCGENMEEIIPGKSDASTEKHVPVYQIKDGMVHVTVGSDKHPMLPEHYIQWIAIKTKMGYQRKNLKPGDEPTATFVLDDGDELESVYEYCNLHALWEA